MLYKEMLMTRFGFEIGSKLSEKKIIVFFLTRHENFVDKGILNISRTSIPFLSLLKRAV